MNLYGDKPVSFYGGELEIGSFENHRRTSISTEDGLGQNGLPSFSPV